MFEFEGCAASRVEGVRVVEDEALGDPARGGGEFVIERWMDRRLVVACEGRCRCGIGRTVVEHLFDVWVQKTVPVLLVGVAHLGDVIYDGPLAHADLCELGGAMESGETQGWVERVAEGAVRQSGGRVADQA